jgi:BASS family bile acid:Na+ symporter
MRIYTPFLATIAVVMIVGSMIASNVAVVSQSGFTIVTAVLTLHSCGFAIGYGLSKALGLSDKVARTNSIEVSLGEGRGGLKVAVGGAPCSSCQNVTKPAKRHQASSKT